MLSTVYNSIIGPVVVVVIIIVVVVIVVDVLVGVAKLSLNLILQASVSEFSF